MTANRELAHFRAINPAQCLESLPAEGVHYPLVKQPPWMANDPLRKVVDRYPQLWQGGKVVWGCIVQVNQTLFADGTNNSPGEVIYDPSGACEPEALQLAAHQLHALKGTQPIDPALRAVADYLSDEMIRVRAMRVPQSISERSLLVSTVLFERDHFPAKKITRPYFPVLMHAQMPGVIMAFPSRWWPQRLRSQWLGPEASGETQRVCTHCGQPMRNLVLDAHYQGKVEVHVCAACTLIWFDGTESTRLAGPGLIDLIRVIHTAMQGERPLQPFPHALNCPVCREPLKRVVNTSTHGCTTQLECSAQHGHYQSFAFFLAEKGFFRPFTWADVKAAAAAGKRLQCVNCGAGLANELHEECPYCKSTVGLVDAARLTKVIDKEKAAPDLTLTPKLQQSSCPSCGGSVVLGQHLSCPHCMAILQPVETDLALAASKSVEASVRANHAQQLGDVSRRKLIEAAAIEHRSSRLGSTEGLRQIAIWAIVVLTLGVLAFGVLGQKTREFQEENVVLTDDDRPPGMSPQIWEGVKNARIDAQMKKIPHAATGVTPPQLSVTANNQGGVNVVNRGARRLKVTVSLYSPYLETRCPMVDANAPSNTHLTFSRENEVHVAVVKACDPKILANGKYEFSVWSLDENRYLFKSESAFRSTPAY
jgi:hypothetical protein